MPRRYRRRPVSQEPDVVLELPTRSGPPPGPEVLPYYWHPNRDGVGQPPEAFAKQLARIAPDVRACYSPVHERWLIWAKNPRIQHDMCKGWQLLFLWEHPITKAYLPLNELVFGNLVIIKVTNHPDAVSYFEKIQAEAQRLEDERKKAFAEYRHAQAEAIYDGTKISTAAPGNRFALHHDGTTIPSRGEVAWRRATEKFRIPSEMVKQRQQDKEREADA